MWYFKAASLAPGKWLPWYYIADVYKKTAFKYAEYLLEHEEDTNGWYYARALIWCYENGFKELL